MRRIRIFEDRLFLAEQPPPGPGPSRIYLHGLGATGEAWAGLWRSPSPGALPGRAQSLAAGGYLVPDLPGMGSSPPSASCPGLDGAAAAVIALARENPAGAVLIGWEAGLFVALRAAEALGAQCRGLVGGLGILDPEDAETWAAIALSEAGEDWKPDLLRQWFPRPTLSEPERRAHARWCLACAPTCRRWARELLEDLADRPAERLARLNVPKALWFPGFTALASGRVAEKAGLPVKRDEPLGHALLENGALGEIPDTFLIWLDDWLQSLDPSRSS